MNREEEVGQQPQPEERPELDRQARTLSPEKLLGIQKGMTVEEVNAVLGFAGVVATIDPVKKVPFTKKPIAGPHIVLDADTDFYEWRAASGEMLLLNVTRGQAVRALVFSPDGKLQRRLF